eukprot:TRINITY_DN2756_c0_g2_i1.p1 TRINITY_DN2756_c0_g2~~TRINITY_DN2756_c0_g2_i1.p1  ORF type:complete len:172 (+),score=32.38 TRINITY_DN2756_c0_g2_i1:189-704(+)
MKTFLVLISLIVGLSVQRDTNPVQSFLSGLYHGVERSAASDLQVLHLVEPSSLDLSKVLDALHQLASYDDTEKIAGAERLYAALYLFSSSSYNVISKDPELSKLMTMTTNLLSNAKDFIARVENFNQNNGADLFSTVRRAANLLRFSAYFNSGIQLGSVLALVSQVKPLRT